MAQEFPYQFKSGLAKGLRETDSNLRGMQALVSATGAVPREGALHSIPSLTRLDISGISPAPSFPFPQFFELRELNILCTATQIYQVNANNSLTLLLGSLTSGSRWSVADYGRFIVLANGKQVVKRDGVSLAWSVDNTFSSALCVCNYHGQAIIGGPNAVA